MRVTKMLSVNIKLGETITVPSNQYWKGIAMFEPTTSSVGPRPIINGIKAEFESGKVHSLAFVGDTTIKIESSSSDAPMIIQGLIFEV